MAKKKKAPKKSSTKRGSKADIPEKKLRQVAARLESGASGIREEGLALGFSSGAPVRKALRGLLGEKEYATVIASGLSARRGNSPKKPAGKSKRRKTKPRKSRGSKGGTKAASK